MLKWSYIVVGSVLGPFLVLGLGAWSLLNLLFASAYRKVALIGWILHLGLYIAVQLSTDSLIFTYVFMVQTCVYLALARAFDSPLSTTQRFRATYLLLALTIGSTSGVLLPVMINHKEESKDINLFGHGYLVWSIMMPVILVINLSRIWLPVSIEKHAKVERLLYSSHLDEDAYHMRIIAGLGTVHVPYSGAKKSDSTMIDLVLVHGFAAGNAFWMTNLQHLSCHFNVVRDNIIIYHCIVVQGIRPLSLSLSSSMP